MALDKKLGINMAINIGELKKRCWPKACFPVGNEVAGRIEEKGAEGLILYDDNGLLVKPKEGYDFNPLPYPMDYHKACYIAEEKTSAVPLDSIIIPGSMGISGLVNIEGIIYGVTCGASAHLFSYHNGAHIARNLGIICRNSGKTSMAVLKGRIYLASDSRDNNRIYIYEKGNINSVKLDIVEGVVSLLADECHGKLYGLSGKGEFFVFNPDASRVVAKHSIDRQNIFSAVLACAPDGNIYGAGRWGHIYSYDPRQNKISEIDLQAPSIKGRKLYNGAISLLADAENNIIYGGTSADGILFKLDLNSMKIISLGKPLNQPFIRCLVLGNDKNLYGIAGKTCCHLFRYEPRSGDLRDIGIFHVESPRPWHGYEFDAAVGGNDGILYFGENDRISHLFRYKV